MAEQTINSISGLSCDSHGARSNSVAARVSEEGVEPVDLQEEQVGGCKSRCQKQNFYSCDVFDEKEK